MSNMTPNAIFFNQNSIEDFKKEHLKEDKKIDHKIPFLFVTLPTPYFASLSSYSSSELFLGEGLRYEISEFLFMLNDGKTHKVVVHTR